MTTETTHLPNHLHYFNHHTGRPRFHFDENNGGGQQQQQQQQQQSAPWHQGLDAETLGHIQNKGWKVDDVKDVVTNAVKQGRELERHFGVPADQLIKLPKADADPKEWRAVHQRLGAPAEAKDYDFSAVKDAAGQPLAAHISDAIRASAFERGLSKDAATSLATAVQKAIDGAKQNEATVKAGKLTDEKTKLKTDWGDKFDFNHLQAMEGARRLGITPEGVAAIEQQIGYAATMEAMRKIGGKGGEDIFVGGGGNNGEVTTATGAVARKAELMADAAWAKRYMDGGAAERQEMDRLNTMIANAT